MKLVLAVDGSEYSEEAIKQVLSYFNPQTTQVKILHVLSPTSSSTPAQPARECAPEMEELQKGVPFNLDHFAERLRSVGFHVDTALEMGEVRSTIIDFSSNWRADLIVIGSHGHRGLMRLLLGNVAESVVRHANCSVLVVRESSKTTKSV